jgi:hypothetical protein
MRDFLMLLHSWMALKEMKGSSWQRFVTEICHRIHESVLIRKSVIMWFYLIFENKCVWIKASKLNREMTVDQRPTVGFELINRAFLLPISYIELRKTRARQKQCNVTRLTSAHEFEFYLQQREEKWDTKWYWKLQRQLNVSPSLWWCCRYPWN